MPDDLRKIYETAGRLQYYFDDKVPCDLFRGQSKTEAKQGLPILYPNPGFKLKDGSDRLPDVMIVVENGKQIVKGCRSTKGDYRGISTFDRKNSKLSGFKWFKLPDRRRFPRRSRSPKTMTIETVRTTSPSRPRTICRYRSFRCG